jgi:oxalate decarboxylase/phosphoglucose isomerase-like protein (cupin superfamily)
LSKEASANASEGAVLILLAAPVWLSLCLPAMRVLWLPRKHLGFVPIVAPQYIENTGDGDLVFLKMFAAPGVSGCLLSQCIRHLPKLIVRDQQTSRIGKSMGYRTTRRQY